VNRKSNRTSLNEEKTQLQTRLKIEGTIDKAVFEEFKHILAQEVEQAETEDRAEPTVSQILEMLLRKGIKTYKTEKRERKQRSEQT